MIGYTLATYLTDRDEQVRQAAAQALGRLGERAPLLAIVWAMQDSESAVRKVASAIVAKRAPGEVERAGVAAARILLRSITDPAEVQAFGALWQVDIITGLGNLGMPHPVFFARLSQSLEWPHWRVKVAAAQALSKIKRHVPPEIIQRLTALRNDPTEMRVVRDACDDALAEILSVDPMEDTL